VPLGAVTICAIARFFHPNRKTKASTMTLRQKLVAFDWPGTAALLPAIICLLLALQWGGNKYAWNSSRIIGLFVGFGLLAIVFIYVQFRRGDDATLPFRIMSQRSLAFGCAVSLGVGSLFFIMVYYIPLWFQVFPIRAHAVLPLTDIVLLRPSKA
jgi:hypothetical protein